MRKSFLFVYNNYRNELMPLVALILLTMISVPTYYYGLCGFVVSFLVVCYLRNCWFGALARAGPLTSRQVPPQPIAYCQQLSAQQLCHAYREGTLSVVEVVSTYINHIKRVNPYLNIMVFDCFEEAMRTAEAADRTYAAWRAAMQDYHNNNNNNNVSGSKRKPPPSPSWLLGVPCTIKECMQCIGCPNSSGQPFREHIISTTDSPVVHNFRTAGAIILGVTNTSELCMWYESSNYVFGITCNPYDTRCLVGGSSGGEGAAAGAAFSAFSLGSDIGGSIRMPAFFNGVYGHKASPHYISNGGQHPGAKSSANHYMATGPISRFVEDIIPLCKVAAEGGFGMDINQFPPCSPLDQIFDLRKISEATSTAHDVPHHTPKRLRVYAIEDFGIPFIHVSESEKRAVHKAAEALRTHYKAEVTFINVRDPSRCTDGVLPEIFKPFAKVLSMWASALTSDPTESKFCDFMAEGHPADPKSGKPYVNWLHELFRWMRGRSRHTLPAISLCILETLELMLPSWMAVSKVGIIIPFKEALEQLLSADGIIICPTFPAPAPRHHYCFWNPMQFQYTAAFNVLRLPATAVPVWLTPEEAQEGVEPTHYTSHSHHTHHHIKDYNRNQHHNHHNHNHNNKINNHNKNNKQHHEVASCLQREDKAVTIEEERIHNLPQDFHLPKGVQIVSASFQDELCISTAVALRELLGGYRYPPWAQLEGVDY